VPSASPAAPAARPNIVLIMAEDVGLRMGVFGDGVAHTPNIDRLASQGMRFTRAFSTAGVCSPSRAAIITGLHQNAWGAGHMRAAGGGYAASPPPHVKAFPELLRAAGYYTLNDGKTDYQMGLALGGAYGGPDSLWDAGASSSWNARAPGQPFFAYINLAQTHESQVWPTWMLPDGLLTLALWPMRIANHLRWPIETDPADVVVPPYYPDTPTVRADLARHYNNIANMDAALGRVLARLAADGLARDTIVIFTADHGDGLPRAKRWLYDSGVHVPLIVRWPGQAGEGAVSQRLVSLIDLPPTLLAMAGVRPPEWMPGRVFVGESESAPRSYVYAARDRIDSVPDTVRAVRDIRFKYIRHFHPDRPYVSESSFRDQMPMMRTLQAMAAAGALTETPALWFRPTRDAEELFDSEADPHEVHNLASDPRYAATLGRMRAALDDWLASHEDLGLLPEAELRARFSPDGVQPQTSAPAVALEANHVRAEPTVEGASIELRIDGGPWRLYTQPVRLEPGQVAGVRAQRHGWRASAPVVVAAVR
jgi:arylsulfatase A-like enzyme